MAINCTLKNNYTCAWCYGKDTKVVMPDSIWNDYIHNITTQEKHIPFKFDNNSTDDHFPPEIEMLRPDMHSHYHPTKGPDMQSHLTKGPDMHSHHDYHSTKHPDFYYPSKQDAYYPNELPHFKPKGTSHYHPNNILIKCLDCYKYTNIKFLMCQICKTSEVVSTKIDKYIDPNQLFNPDHSHYICHDCKHPKKFCEHEWVKHSGEIFSEGVAINLVCRKCGHKKTTYS